MTHVAGEGGKSDWSPLHLQNDCFPLTTFGWGNVETCTELHLLTFARRACGIKKSLLKVQRLWHNWCVQAHPDAHEHKPPAPSPVLIWTNARSKWGSFVKLVSQTVLFKTQKQKAAQKRKKTPNWVWVQGQCGDCLNKSQRSPTTTTKKKSINFREKAPLSRPLWSFWKDGFL